MSQDKKEQLVQLLDETLSKLFVLALLEGLSEQLSQVIHQLDDDQDLLDIKKIGQVTYACTNPACPSHTLSLYSHDGGYHMTADGSPRRHIDDGFMQFKDRFGEVSEKELDELYMLRTLMNIIEAGLVVGTTTHTGEVTIKMAETEAHIRYVAGEDCRGELFYDAHFLAECISETHYQFQEAKRRPGRELRSVINDKIEITITVKDKDS